MDNYGNDYFMSQEGYASIDFTLLDRPNSNIASAPESTAALLPDLHVGEASFSSFDFLDGPGVDTFGGVLRDADEAHSRDHNGYRGDQDKYRKDVSEHNDSVALHRGDGDSDTELPSSGFHVAYEKPISNLDFFSQGHTKDSGQQGQQRGSDAGNDVTDGGNDYFESGQMSQSAHARSGGGGWSTGWAGTNSQGDQTQVFFQTPSSYEESSAQKRLMQEYNSLSSSHVPDNNPAPKATHSFLPVAKQNDSRQAPSAGLNHSNAQMSPMSGTKSNPRNQLFNYDGAMNSSGSQMRQNLSSGVENATASRRFQATDDTNLARADMATTDGLRNHTHSQNFKYGAQQLEPLGSVEASPLKDNNYYLGGQFGTRVPAQMEAGEQQQLAVDEMQAWQQHSILPQSHQQQSAFQQPYQDLSRQGAQQHHIEQQSHNTRQQNIQHLMGVTHGHQGFGNQQLSPFMSETSLQDLPRMTERQHSSQVTAVDNQRATLLQPNFQQLSNANLSWSANEPSTMQGLAHDYLMGPDHSFNWQALALKASQLEPSMYGNLPTTRRDHSGQPLPAYNTGVQSGLQEFYSGTGKLTAPVTADASRHLARNLGSGDSGGAVYGGEYQHEVYDAAANLQATAHSKHQALGKMPFWQNPYPQSTEQSRGGSNLTQSSLPPRSPQIPAPAQVRPQRAWSGLPNHQESLRSGLFAQNVTNTEALKQSLISGGGIHQGSQPSANVRASSRSQNLEGAQYIAQGATQTASSSQFSDVLGRKQQNNWNRMSIQQQNVPQGGVSPENNGLDSNPKGAWAALNAQHVAADSQSLSSLKQQSMWSGHNAQQSSGSPVNSLHLFADVDARRSNIHGVHNLHQGSSQSSGSQQMGKVDINSQNSHSVQSGTGAGNEATNMPSSLDARQQHNGWRDHGIQTPSQNINSLQSYGELDKTSSWKNIWQTSSAAEGSPQLQDMDDGRRQSNLWSRNLQKSSSHAVESRGAAINSRDPSGWTAQDDQQETRQTNQLLPNLDAQTGNHHSHSLSERHPSHFGHYNHEGAGRSKSAVEVEARHSASQNAYSLQPQVAPSDGDMRVASQTAYSLQSQAGAVEPDTTHKAAQNLYHLQTQAGLGETETTHKGSLAAYSLQQPLETGESHARHVSNQMYESRAQAAAGDSNAGNSSLNSFNMQSQAASTDEDPWHRSTIQESYSLQSQMGAMDIDAQRNGSSNAYNLQSQVGIGEDVRHKNSNSVYTLHSPLGAHAQSGGSVDGRHTAPHWSHSTQQQTHSQSATSMYAFPSMTAKDHASQNLRSVQTWNASVDSVDGWQAASGTGARVLLQPTGLSQVNSSDARHQQAQSGSNSQHSGPQAASQLHSLSSRPQSRLGRLNNSQEASVFGSMGPSAMKSSTGNHWHQQQQHAGNTSAMSGSHGDFPVWSQRHGLHSKDGNKVSTGEEPKSGSADGLPAWSRGQSFAAQQSMDHVSGGSAPVGGRNDVPQPWQRGQSLSVQEETQRFNLGEESQTGISDAHRQWPQGKPVAGQQSLEEGDFARDASGGGLDDETRSSWSRQQKLSTGSELEQQNLLGDSNSMNDEIPPDWSRSQGTIPHLDELNRSKSSEDGAKELMTWPHGQPHLPTRSSDHHNIDADSISARADVSNWSHQPPVPSRTDTDQFNFAGEANIGENEGASSWSEGRPGRKPFEHPNLEQSSKGEKFDQSHGENVLSQKDVEQLNQADGNHIGVPIHAKDHLYPRLEAEKRAQAERRFLEGGTTRESNSLASPAPSPESTVFSSAAKQKSGPKASSLSKNTLDLLSKPEDPDELSSMNDEDNEAEGDMEDSGANASSISLAHLRRNQASGPLSPQGFGLRLAPPSHLSQNSQAGNSSRLLHSASNLGGGESGRLVNAPSNKEQSQPVRTGNADGANKRGSDNEPLDPSIPTAYGKSSLVPEAAMSAGATADSHQDSHPRIHEALSSDIHETSSGGTHKTDGNTSQKSVSASPVNVGTSQSAQAMPSSGDSAQMDAVLQAPSAPLIDPAVGQTGTVDDLAMNSVVSPPRTNAVVNAVAGSPSRPQFSSNVSAQHPMAEQRDPLSKLLSTFKDTLSGPSQQTSVQQQANTLERGSAGLFESLRTQAGKQVNGFQPPTPWTGDPTSMAMRAELRKRYAVQSKGNQQGTEYLSVLNASSKQSPVGSGTIQRQTGTGQARSGQLAYAQGSNFAVQTASGQSRPGQPIQPGQPFPGQEATASPSHSDQRQDQSQEAGEDGLVLPEGHDISGQAMMLEQSQPLASQLSGQSGSASGQTYSRHAFPNGQVISGQSNLAGIPYHMYNSSRVVAPPDNASRLGQRPSSGHQFPSPPVPQFQGDPRLETTGQQDTGRAVGQSVLGKVNKPNQRKLSKRAAGRDLSKMQMLDKSTPHQTVEFSASGEDHQTDQQAPGPHTRHSLVQNSMLPSQYDVGPEPNDLSGAVPSQETLKIQPASMAPVERASSEERGAGDSLKGFEEAEKSSGVPGLGDAQGPSRQSGIEQLPVQQDNQGDGMIQQLEGTQPWNAASGLTDYYQFQRILETHKGNPRAYNFALAQLRSSLGQASVAKQFGLYQQQAREQGVASASTSVAKPLNDGLGTGSGSQGSQMSQASLLQGAQGTQLGHTLQAFQTGLSNQIAQSHVNAAQAMKALQVAQALQIGQVPPGQLPDQTSEAVKAAVICQNASTAARLQFLAQRGQNGHGMGGPWFSGIGSRSGITPPLTSRYAVDGRSADGAMTAAALRHDDPSGSRSPLTPFYPPLVKKRKEPPALIPWRDAISQAGGYASSMSSSELEWAHATNRIPDTEPFDDLGDAMDSRGIFQSRIRRRLRLTTQLMQQITPAVPQKYMKSNTIEDREDATYIISRLAFTEACRFASIARRIKDVAAARDAEESRIEREKELAMKEAEKSAGMTKRVVPERSITVADKFKTRMNQLEGDLRRLETSRSAVDLVKDMQDTERVNLVNRITVYHSLGAQKADFPSKQIPQKYVTPVDPQDVIPEGLLCVSL